MRPLFLMILVGLVVSFLWLSGCASVAVDKRMLVVVNPMCEYECDAGAVTANMNSGTSVETAIDAALKAALK